MNATVPGSLLLPPAPRALCCCYFLRMPRIVVTARTSLFSAALVSTQIRTLWCGRLSVVCVGKDHRRRAKSRCHTGFPGLTSPQSLSSLLPRIGTQPVSVLERASMQDPSVPLIMMLSGWIPITTTSKIGPMSKGVICGMYFSLGPLVQHIKPVLLALSLHGLHCRI